MFDVVFIRSGRDIRHDALALTKAESINTTSQKGWWYLCMQIMIAGGSSVSRPYKSCPRSRNSRLWADLAGNAYLLRSLSGQIS